MKNDFFISPKFNDLVLTHTKVYGFIIQLCPSQKKRDKITELMIKQIKNRKRMETTAENTDQNISDMLIGYSAFKIFDDCYEYNENACYIADTPVSLKEFLDGAMLSVDDYRIESVYISDILNDFGYSSGEYALEPKALEKFERAAKELEITYTVEPYEENLNNEKQPDLFVVNLVEKKKTSQISRENKIDDILKSFEIFDGVYKREQVDVAIGRKDEITPFLIDILMKIVSNPTKFIEIENYYAHIYALMLLGSFKENKAHKVIVDLFNLPEDILEELFGELMVEDLPAIFFRTSHGRFDLIKTLALNKEAAVSSRDAALKALVFAVAEGVFPREELVFLLDQLFKDNPISYSWDFGDRLAHHVHDIYPEELMDTIEQAYKDELISPGFISYHDFENALKAGKEKCYEKIRLNLQENSLDDLHARMSWWACFRQEKSVAAPVYAEPSVLVTKPKKKVGKKKSKKKKRKMTKASKRKNRK
jgi:hypothetical protein